MGKHTELMKDINVATVKSIECVNVPTDWTFPGFISFVVYGPFADPHDRLCVFKISDEAPGLVQSRATKRKA